MDYQDIVDAIDFTGLFVALGAVGAITIAVKVAQWGVRLLHRSIDASVAREVRGWRD